MIRKAIIVGMTLGAVTGIMLWCLSIVDFQGEEWKYKGGGWRFRAGPNTVKEAFRYSQDPQTRIYLHFYDGIISFTLQYLEDIELSRLRPNTFEYQLGGFVIKHHVRDTLSRRTPDPTAKEASVETIYYARARLLILSLILSCYPTIAFIRGPLRRWRRKKKGLCLKCGYDLTGNESGVCPECGVRLSSGK